MNRVIKARLQGPRWYAMKNNLFMVDYEINEKGHIKGYYKEKDRDGYLYSHWLSNEEIKEFKKRRENMKRLEINLKGTNTNISNIEVVNALMDRAHTTLTGEDYPYIYLDHKITDEDFEKAIDIVITKFMQDGLYYVVVDLEERNESRMPVKEMTMEELEKVLGYKVKVVNKKENE